MECHLLFPAQGALLELQVFCLCVVCCTDLFVFLPDLLLWESSSWKKQQEELSEHMSQGGVYQDSIHRRFTLDEKEALLQWSNLQPTRWAPEQTNDIIPPADFPGYYIITILGKEKATVTFQTFQPLLWNMSEHHLLH